MFLHALIICFTRHETSFASITETGALFEELVYTNLINLFVLINTKFNMYHHPDTLLNSFCIMIYSTSVENVNVVSFDYFMSILFNVESPSFTARTCCFTLSFYILPFVHDK